MFNCVDGQHYLVKSMTCYSNAHIILSVFSIIFLAFLLAINIIIALLYNETQPVKEDALSRLESTFEITMLIYRIFVATFTMVCNSSYCSWILIFIYLGSSFLLCYQYYIFIPYYNPYVSVFFGSFVGTYFWISLNSVAMKFYILDGHIIVIVLGIPLVVYLVRSLREKRIQTLMESTTEKIKTDSDALIQITTI